MRGFVVALAIVLTIALTTPALADVTINPPSISEQISQEKTIVVRIQNTFSYNVSVVISKTDINVDINLTSLNITPNSYKDISVKLYPDTYSGKIYYSWSYTANNTTYSGVVEQPVSVSVSYEDVVVYPEDLDVDVPINEERLFYVIVTNPSKVDVEVKINYTGEVIKDVHPLHFTLDAGESREVDIRVAGLSSGASATGRITYRFEYPLETKTFEQTVHVSTYKPEYVRELENLREKYNQLQTSVELPDRIKVEWENPIAGQRMKVKVSGYIDNSWRPLERVPVALEDQLKFTDSSGVAHFVPQSAGIHTIRVYDRFGNVKYERTVNVTKHRIDLHVGEVQVGQLVPLDLPEPGTLEIYKDDVLVKELSVDENCNFTVDKPGIYRLKFSSPSYEGSCKFIATGKIMITATANNQQIQPGSTVKPGTPIQFGFTYQNGMPAEVDVEYTLIPESQNEDNFFRFIMMQWFLSQTGSDCVTPYYAKKTAVSSLTLIPPDEKGVMTIKVEGDAYTDPATFTLYVEPGFAPPYPLIALALSATLLTGIFAYKNNIKGFRDRILRVVPKKRGDEPP